MEEGRWTLFVHIFGILLILTASVRGLDPDFVAPVNPCRPEDVICPVHCQLMKMSGVTDCEFCFCKSPVDSVLWPEQTTTLATTPTTPLPPGYSIVNNITYVELQHPCWETGAMCPITCSRSNVTQATGNVCEICQCPNINSRDNPVGNQQENVFGKRSGHTEIRASRLHPRGIWNSPCMPLFACPIFNCPVGQHFQRSPNGCRTCKCVPNEATDTTTMAPATKATPTTPTTTDPARFLKMFCLSRAEYCPAHCHVTDYRVGTWHCYHCGCSNGQTFVALQTPCEAHSYVCSSDCTIRNLQDVHDSSTSCQFCDCLDNSEQDTMVRRFLFGTHHHHHPGPGHNQHVHQSGPEQGGNGFDHPGPMPAGPGQGRPPPPGGHGYGPGHPPPGPGQHPPQPAHVPSSSAGHHPHVLDKCLTNAADCPIKSGCSLWNVGNLWHTCHLCTCGKYLFHDSDVGRYNVLHNHPANHPPSTLNTVTQLPSTLQPSSQSQSTLQPSTQSPATSQPTTQSQSTLQPSTQSPSTLQPSTLSQSTSQPSTQSPTTLQPSTQSPTTLQPTAQSPTPPQPTTQSPTTLQPSTQSPTTLQPTTQSPITLKPTTQSPTTLQPSTQSPTTLQPSTQSPTTLQPSTQKLPTTLQPTTQSPTTLQPSTQSPTTLQPSTTTSQPPVTSLRTVPRTTPTATPGLSTHVMVTAQPTVAPSTSCYICKDTDCKKPTIQKCAPGKNYCLNTINQDSNGGRDFIRECVEEDECYTKWWLQTMSNPVCLGLYNTEKGAANQPEVCHFCCKGPACNSAARIEDYKLYTGGDHVIG